jgi:hydrogenase-4 component F
VLSNALTKGALFLVAGNLLQLYGTSAMGSVEGVLRRAPVTGALLVIGLFAALGLPPFGLFISEFTILRAALAGDASAWPAALYLTFLAIIFLGMCAAVLPMAQGASREREPLREPLATVVPPAVFAAAVLVLGVWVPQPIAKVIAAAAKQLGVS